jgi:hypothetical protein
MKMWPKFPSDYSILSFVVLRYHLKDVVFGKIYFLLVRIKIKHMELAIIRREAAGSGRHGYTAAVIHLGMAL